VFTRRDWSGNSQRRNPYAHWILLSLFVVQFAVSFRPDALAWDGVFYYSYARSAIFDGDLRLRNDFILSYSATPSAAFVDQHFERKLTPTGRVDNPFAIGTSLLWLPWCAFIYGLASLAGQIGLGPQAITGYEWYFTWGVATVTCVYGWVAILTGFRLARELVSDWAALVTTATVMFATPLTYYQFREPFYAHTASAMTVALFAATWWRGATHGSHSVLRALLVGMLGGLAALVRSQNAVYLILPTLTGLSTGCAALRKRQWAHVRRALQVLLATGLGASLVMTLQFSVWHKFYGQWLAVPQGGAFLNWRAPWMGHVLFSAFHGLLPWVPLVLPAVSGLILLIPRIPRLSVPLLMAFLLQVYVNSCVRDWFGAGGYGGRRFSNTLVILIVGYAWLLDWRRERWYRLLVIGLSAGLVLHQWLILRYGFANRLGGYVVSMAPDYEWQADGIARFWQQLAGYISLAVWHPIQTIVVPASPVATMWSSPTRFARQFSLLVAILGILLLVRAGWRDLSRRFRNPTIARFLLVICLVALTLLADWWVLTRA